MAHILLVEDGAGLRNALVLALRSERHVVAEADDGERGIAMQPGFNRVQVRAGGEASAGASVTGYNEGLSLQLP